jgi:hypothetical protein
LLLLLLALLLLLLLALLMDLMGISWVWQVLGPVPPAEPHAC